MRIDQLNYLVVLSECRSISEASEKLHISYQALGYFLKRAEDEFHTKIFTRSKNGLCITHEGKKVIDFAKKTFTAYQNICMPEKKRDNLISIYATLVYEISSIPNLLAEKYQNGVFLRNFTLSEVIQKIKNDCLCGKQSIGLINFGKKYWVEKQQLFKENNLVYQEIFTSNICILASKNNVVMQENSCLDSLEDVQTIVFGRVEDQDIIALVNMNYSGISTESYTMWMNYILQKKMIGVVYDVVLCGKTPISEIIDNLVVLHPHNEIKGSFGILIDRNASEDIKRFAFELHTQIRKSMCQ